MQLRFWFTWCSFGYWPHIMQTYDKVILAGVGSFPAGMKEA